MCFVQTGSQTGREFGVGRTHRNLGKCVPEALNDLVNLEPLMGNSVPTSYSKVDAVRAGCDTAGFTFQLLAACV